MLNLIYLFKGLIVRPSSIKWVAIKAKDKIKQPIKRRRIDFSCAILFTNIPKLIKNGFKQ